MHWIINSVNETRTPFVQNNLPILLTLYALIYLGFTYKIYTEFKFKGLVFAIVFPTILGLGLMLEIQSYPIKYTLNEQQLIIEKNNQTPEIYAWKEFKHSFQYAAFKKRREIYFYQVNETNIQDKRHLLLALEHAPLWKKFFWNFGAVTIQFPSQDTLKVYAYLRQHVRDANESDIAKLNSNFRIAVYLLGGIFFIFIFTYLYIKHE